ncbi:MAG: hypothetical protein ABWY36_02215 [Leifsonia sp.]
MVELAALDTSEMDDEALWLMLEEPEWLETEFEAIMRASGVVDGAAVAMAPRTPGPRLVWTGGHGPAPGREWRGGHLPTAARTRVRSPPLP